MVENILRDKLKNKLENEFGDKLRGNLRYKLGGNISWERLRKYKVEKSYISCWEEEKI